MKHPKRKIEKLFGKLLFDINPIFHISLKITRILAKTNLKKWFSIVIEKKKKYEYKYRENVEYNGKL